jgi:hypothetical protein
MLFFGQAKRNLSSDGTKRRVVFFLNQVQNGQCRFLSQVQKRGLVFFESGAKKGGREFFGQVQRRGVGKSGESPLVPGAHKSAFSAILSKAHRWRKCVGGVAEPA